MSQQIINIPINWDDDAIKTCIEKGVIEEVKNDISKQALHKLGLDSRYHGPSESFDKHVRDCVKELVVENKDYILEEVISRVRKSIVSTKDYKKAKKELLLEKEK